MQRAHEEQGGFAHLDAAPRTVKGSENRVPVGTDGDYFCKPNVETSSGPRTA